LPGIIRRIESRSRRWVWHLAWMGAKLNTYRIMVVKSERKYQ
jgi:hypothetical protein